MAGILSFPCLLLSFVVAGYSSAQSLPDGPCRPARRLDNESVCIRHITDLLFDENHFYFGKQLDNTCNAVARNNSDDINCFADDGNTRRYSLASRLFSNNFRAETIDRFLTVTFTTSAGRYKACGAEKFPIDPRTTDVNPDMDPTAPVYVRSSPGFDMRTDKDVFYTILVIDATFGYVHGLFVDYPAPKDIIPFVPPFNYRNITNTFVFVVYRQPEREYMLEPRTIGLMKNPALAHQFRLNDFAADHALAGPVAMNWMAVTSDPWAVQQVADRFGENYCVKFLVEAFSRLSFTQLGNLPFRGTNQSSVPYDVTQIDMALNVTFAVPATNIFVCCQPFKTDASEVTLNPITPSGQVVDNEVARSEPTVIVQKTALRPQAENAVRQYTIVAVNPELIGTLGVSDAPYLIWLASDLSEDRTSQTDLAGKTILPYKLPALPASAEPEKIFFLLFEQTSGALNKSSAAGFASSDNCPAEYSGRCRFRLAQFAVENRLVLRGVNWITVKSQELTRYNAIVKGGEKEDVVCKDQPVYSVTCPRPTSRMDAAVTPPAGKSTGSTFTSVHCFTFLLTAVLIRF